MAAPRTREQDYGRDSLTGHGTGYARDPSAGLVRVLLGDFEGAIADFELLIEQITWNAGRRAQRQAWVEALRVGHNPFTPEVLAELRAG